MVINLNATRLYLNKFYKYYGTIKYSTKVPVQSVPTLLKRDQLEVSLDKNTITLLERLSLVKCDTSEGVRVLEDSILFANKILHIDTTNVQPLYSVLENENLMLRQDKITQGYCQKDILKNASVKEDDYFVAPPGNIPLQEVEHKNEKNWLKTILTKTEKYFPIIIKQSLDSTVVNSSRKGIAFIKPVSKVYTDCIIEHKLPTLIPDQTNKCIISVILPQSEIMPYFLQWQKYRKYWWSSISTTPGLFNLNGFKLENKLGEVNIVAQFPWGTETVEGISIDKYTFKSKSNQLYGKLHSEFNLETALLTLLLDGLMNQTKEGYLKLNRNVAPYKISFAIAFKDETHKRTLQELTVLLNHKLQKNRISTWLPDFSISTTEQLLMNRQLGVQYIAVLDDQTLSNGIFHLMNSSTMLMEQIHIADFDSYASILCKG